MRIIEKTALTSVISVMMLSFTAVPVLALGAADHAHTTEVAQASSQVSASSQAEVHQAAAQTKLADAQLKACQNREKAVDNIMTRIAERGQKQLDLFTTIATRTETFYTTKGKTLSNYNALVADVTAKKAAAQTEVDTIKASSTTFKCDGTDPKGVVTAFKDSLKAEIAALNAYRTSVKNLIVGVKSVQGTTTSTNATSSTGQTTGGTQ